MHTKHAQKPRDRDLWVWP